MRSLLISGVLILAAAGSTMAQNYPKGEVAGNYTYLRFNPGEAHRESTVTGAAARSPGT